MSNFKPKIYLDSTVPNYVFNNNYIEKQKSAQALFNAFKQKQAIGFISPATIYEIEASNEPKRTKMLKLLNACNLLKTSEESENLAKHYIQQNVFTKVNREDARHVAYAVFYRINIIASYNFSHIVRLSTIKKLQVVNLVLGYLTPEIRSPEEIDL